MAPRHSEQVLAALAQVYARPGDDGARVSLADALEREGRPEAELIRLQLLSQRNPARERALVGGLRDRLHFRLRGQVVHEATQFERGLPVGAHAGADGQADAPLTRAAWRTLRRVRFSHAPRWESMDLEPLETLVLDSVVHFRAVPPLAMRVLELGVNWNHTIDLGALWNADFTNLKALRELWLECPADRLADLLSKVPSRVEVVLRNPDVIGLARAWSEGEQRPLRLDFGEAGFARLSGEGVELKLKAPAEALREDGVEALQRAAKAQQVEFVAGGRRHVQPRQWSLAQRSSFERLLDAVYADPDSDDKRRVLADALLDVGDPRGEFISRQLKGDAAKELLQRHREKLHFALERQVAMGATRFERGFPSAVYVHEWLADGPKLSREAFSTVKRAELKSNVAVLQQADWSSLEHLELGAGVVLKLPSVALKRVHTLELNTAPYFPGVEAFLAWREQWHALLPALRRVTTTFTPFWLELTRGRPEVELWLRMGGAGLGYALDNWAQDSKAPPFTLVIVERQAGRFSDDVGPVARFDDGAVEVPAAWSGEARYLCERAAQRKGVPLRVVG